MGMYTELMVEGSIRHDAPAQVKHFVNVLFNRDYHISGADVLPKPDHPFFQCSRWNSVGNCSSFYHLPFSMSAVSTPHTGDLCFISRSDLKNYDNEIALFLDWIKPYCNLLRGWHLYEEDQNPTVFNYEKN